MLRGIAAVVSVLSLGICLVAPLLYFWGSIGDSVYKQFLSAASVGWFVAATVWATRKSP
jgi:hypothetical protein